MEYREHEDRSCGDLVVTLRVSMLEQHAMQRSIEDHLVHRLIGTLYEELLPVMRERVGNALNAHTIARAIESEIRAAIYAAFGGHD